MSQSRYTLYRSLMEQAGLPPKSEPEWREAVLERYAARAERDADLELYALELKDFDHEPWSEDSSGMLTHRFATEGPKGTTPYEARMVPQHSDPQQRPVYNMAFIDPTSSRPYGVTGAGGAPETIAHVASLLNHTVKTKAPNAITFSAAEPTRQRAYRMAMRHLAHRHPDYVPVSVGHDPTDIHDFAIVHREHLPHFESHLATTTGQKAWHIPAVGQPDPHRAKINELTKPKKEITNLKPLDIQYEPERLPSAAPIAGPSPWGGEPLEAPTTPNRGWFGPKPRSKPARYTMTAQEIDDAVASWKAPSKAQVDAENYRKPRIRIHGLEIAIENPKGTRRKPDWPELSAHYGYVSRVSGQSAPEARDEDKVDVFVGPTPRSEIVFVIDQEHPSGRYDEPKVLIGYTNEQDARRAYLASYSPGWHCGPITAMTVEQFKSWLQHGDTKQRVAEQVSRYTEPGEPARYAAREWVGVDLDGTLAYFDGNFSKWEIGPPIWRMVERVKGWLAQGRDVRILTARVHGPDAEQQRRLIQDWCRKYIGRVLPITNQKDPAMAELWDDRAIQVARNTGEPVGRFTQPGQPARYKLFRGDPGAGAPKSGQWWTSDRDYAGFYSPSIQQHDAQPNLLDITHLGVDAGNDRRRLAESLEEAGVDPAAAQHYTHDELYQWAEHPKVQEAVRNAGYDGLSLMQWNADYGSEPVESTLFVKDQPEQPPDLQQALDQVADRYNLSASEKRELLDRYCDEIAGPRPRNLDDELAQVARELDLSPTEVAAVKRQYEARLAGDVERYAPAKPEITASIVSKLRQMAKPEHELLDIEATGPLTLYHGTSADFGDFNPDADEVRTDGKWDMGRGVYLTDDLDAAKKYAVMAAKRTGRPPRVRRVQVLGGKYANLLHNDFPFSTKALQAIAPSFVQEIEGDDPRQHERLAALMARSNIDDPSVQDALTGAIQQHPEAFSRALGKHGLHGTAHFESPQHWGFQYQYDTLAVNDPQHLKILDDEPVDEWPDDEESE